VVENLDVWTLAALCRLTPPRGSRSLVPLLNGPAAT
jgi:hypothetical protein